MKNEFPEVPFIKSMSSSATLSQNTYPKGWGGVHLDHPHAHGGKDAQLMVGARRSYGDVCELREGQPQNYLQHNRFLAWDESSATLTAQAGMTIGELCDWASPKGFFAPVVPGTQFATLGGCLANDVHGKNHLLQGSFGCHVKRFSLIRENKLLECSPHINNELFYASIGGLGLTGVIDNISLSLIPMKSPWLSVQHHTFQNLEEFFTLDEWFGQQSSYNVSWLDCSPALWGQSHQSIRGIYSIAEPMPSPPTDRLPPSLKTWAFPAQIPFSLIHPWSTAVFNALYWRIPRSRKPSPIHYRPFLFPLDRVALWNRLYGKKGFFQFQCILPRQHAFEGLLALLHYIRRSGEGSPLVVLKQLGARKSGGLLSFPREGYTLALDFPHRGAKTLQIMHDLETITESFDGALYPAKDACMSANIFKRSFPHHQDLERLREPGRISDFWLRMLEGKH